MEPQFIKNDKYIEVIGHYDNEVLCAKMTLLADLYAIKHRDGYAKFNIEDENKLDIINESLCFFALAPEPEPVPAHIVYIYVDNVLKTTLRTPMLTPEDTVYLWYAYDNNSLICMLNITNGYMGTVRNNGVVIGNVDPNYLIGTSSAILVDTTSYLDGDPCPYLIDIDGSSFYFTSITITESIDCSTLSGWSSLSSGTHSITLRASADGYRDSVDSTAIGVIKPVTYTITPTCTNVTASASNPTTIAQGGTAVLTFTADGTNYKVPESMPAITGATGTYTRISNTECTITLRNPIGNVSFTVEGEEALTELCFTANTAGSTVELIVVGSPSISNTAYSTDKQTWNTFTPSTTAGTNVVTLTNVGDKVYFRNDITANFSSTNYMNFVMSGSIAASGNVNSMYDADGYYNLDTLVYAFCYVHMFQSCASLTTAPSLPATKLASDCYLQMFYDCTSLTTPPALPATTLASYCYTYMFAGCTSLTTVPLLPATTLATYCYYQMFYGCTSLTTTPPNLPATTLAISCYYGMFSGCTSLITAPSLPATKLASYCYREMFYGCTSLTTAPTLPVIKLAYGCYYGMFAGCTSLTIAPNLPATTLADICYHSMFNGCTSLTTAPSLPATTLTYNCYCAMFSGCTSLYVSDTQTSSASCTWNIPSSGTFTNTTTYNQSSMFTNCLGTRSSNTMTGAQGESHTYYTQNTPV